MKYAVGNIVQMIDKVSAIVITTNGFTKSNGEAVMGRGIAEQFKNAYPELPRILGSKIIQGKNNVHFLKQLGRTRIYSFPVKAEGMKLERPEQKELIVSHARFKYDIGMYVPGFALKADIAIIERSLKQLAQIHVQDGLSSVVVPIVGCGAGELSFNKDGIHQLMLENLNDNFYCMSYNKIDFFK